MNRLIQCSDGGHAPWCLVCTHVFEGTADSVVRIINEGPGQDDYICTDCAATLDDIGVEDLRAVCIHCARRLVEGLEEVGDEE
jgi:DNA-directed RNA polymerase subunit RPC12/RpoP